MPDMSEFHETEEEMEDRCDAQRDSEKLDDSKPSAENLLKAGIAWVISLGGKDN
jgi:hypothetical protein